MSAVPTHLALVGAHEKRHWLTVAELAAASGISVRTIRWNCRHGDLQNCHRWEKNPSGGPEILKIDLLHAPEKYRLAYAQSHSAEHGGAILKLTDKQLQEAARMQILIQEADAYIVNNQHRGVTQKTLLEEFLSMRRARHPDTPSPRTYFRNKARWLEGGKALISLADGRRIPGKGVKAQFDEEAFSYFCSLYLIQGEPKAADCYRTLLGKARQEGWCVPCLKTVMRTLDARVPKAKQDELRKGKEYRRNHHDAYLLRDWTEMVPNEFWVSDHRQFDILAIDDLAGGDGKPARLWLTTWMDERTRFVVGWRIHRGPCAREVMASFYHSVLVHGIPQNIRVDNGKDYRCKRFAGGKNWREEIARVQLDETAVRPVLMGLGITPHFAEVFNARAKIVETWHGHRVKNDFDRHVTGYCGGNTQERPEELNGFNGKGGLIKAGALLHWSLVVRMFAEFINTYNLESNEGIGGKCPAMVRQELPWTKNPADPRALAKLLQDCRPLTIGPMGLMIDGAAYGIGNPEIIVRQGEKVHVYMDLFGQIGTVYVYEPNGIFICTAENTGRSAAHATREDLVEKRKLVKRHNKMIDQLAVDMPVIQAIDPVEKIAMRRQYAEDQLRDQGIDPQQLLAGDQPTSFKPSFQQQANMLPPPASKRLRIAGETLVEKAEENQRMESPTQNAEGVLPSNILDAFTAG